MFVRYNTVIRLQLLQLSIVTLLTIGRTPTSLALPIMKDSPIQKIIVPYQPSTANGMMLMSNSGPALLPVTMEVLQRFNLNEPSMTMGSLNGAPLNFADGAYPVYYMPSSVNGKFNGKISLLEAMLKE